MKAVGIVGRSDTGKTTLVEAIVPELDGRVATVKSIHHAVEIDDPGTDTYRHRLAGAEKVVGVTPGLTFAIEPMGKDAQDTAWQALSRVLLGLEGDGFDIVVVEGFTTSPLPKVVVGDLPESLNGEVIRMVATPGSPDVDAVTSAIIETDDWDSYT